MAAQEDIEKSLARTEAVELVLDSSKNDEVDPYLVTWNGNDDPEHPYNWPLMRKWAITILLSNGGLVTLMSGVMLALALQSISADLNPGEEETQIFLSIFVLAFAFGPMVLSPLAEVFGRRPVWILFSCFYILWNTVAGFSRTPGLMIASRVLSGIGASAEFTISNPVLSDSIGPIIGGAVSQSIGWRWTFWILSLYDGLFVIIALFIFQETYEVITFDRRAARLRKSTGIPYYTQSRAVSETLAKRLSHSMTRPVRLLLTQPVIQVVAIFLAYNFGILYLVLSTFANFWIDRYGQTETQSGLNYIALVIGYTIASQVGSRVMDRLWAYLKAKAGNNTAPEYRIPLMISGAILIPLGLFIYGWTAERHVHWIVPDIGIAILGCVIDAYHEYVASASAASQFLRSIAGFAFPIFAPAMYQNLGYGWGNSLLALTFVVIGCPAPFLPWRYGATLRAMGKKQR
ncbi:MFS general substrate transporter [Jackrogersella minutella]|nr:MFS general substrate transporter [Jackrogersella minutella]